jgi:hypothetical protein
LHLGDGAVRERLLHADGKEFRAHVIVFLPRKRMVPQIEKLFQVGATFF